MAETSDRARFLRAVADLQAAFDAILEYRDKEGHSCGFYVADPNTLPGETNYLFFDRLIVANFDLEVEYDLLSGGDESIDFGVKGLVRSDVEVTEANYNRAFDKLENICLTNKKLKERRNEEMDSDVSSSD